MNRKHSLLALLFAAFLPMACGGNAEANDAPMEEAAPEAEMASEGMAMEASLDACYLARGTVEEAQARPSPLSAAALGDMGTICWGAPSANGREVMGALVPYGSPWRMGANEATAIHLTTAATVGGVALEPGSYSMFAVPGADSWEIVLNSNVERWGIPIDEGVRATDVGSVSVTPEATDEMVETLTYSYEHGTGIVMEWENTRVTIPVGM